MIPPPGPMRSLVPLLLLAACAPGAAPRDAADPVAPAAVRVAEAEQRRRFAEVDRLLEAMRDSIGVRGISLVVLRGDTILYDRSLGGLAGDDRIPIASASKWLAGAVVASLADDSLLALDDRVGRFLPEAPPDKRYITLAQLFSHTSGLPPAVRCLGRRDGTTAACAAEILARPLRALPGTRFEYGGASMQLGARAAELAGGRDWETLFQERLARPLGMRATTFTGRGVGTLPRVAGGAVSSRDDYARFLRMILADGVRGDRRILSAAAVREMERDRTRDLDEPGAGPAARGYGIGLWIERADSAGRTLVASSPGAFGFTPWIDRERNVAAVLAMTDRLDRVGSWVGRVRRAVEEGVRQGE